jgi:hypothetical protein
VRSQVTEDHVTENIQNSPWYGMQKDEPSDKKIILIVIIQYVNHKKMKTSGELFSFHSMLQWHNL